MLERCRSTGLDLIVPWGARNNLNEDGKNEENPPESGSLKVG